MRREERSKEGREDRVGERGVRRDERNEEGKAVRREDRSEEERNEEGGGGRAMKSNPLTSLSVLTASISWVAVSPNLPRSPAVSAQWPFALVLSFARTPISGSMPRASLTSSTSWSSSVWPP